MSLLPENSVAASKPLIVHCIDSLHLGGAEILLRNTLHGLPQFRHHVVYLAGPETLKNSFPPDTKYTCLEHLGWKDLLRSVRRLRKLIRKEKPLLVHAHLFNSILISRLAVPKSTPFVSTLHSVYSKDAFEKNWKSLVAEKLTVRKRHAMIGVSQFVLDDYLKFVPFKGKSFVLYNFLPEEYTKVSPPAKQRNTSDRWIAVANLRAAKNFLYLVEIFKHLKDSSLSLDIYGKGHQEEEIKQIINENGLRVNLKGHALINPSLLSEYDAFILAPEHEGFGISVIEAMATSLPVVLSDIPVFREVTNNLGHFFPVRDAPSAAKVLAELAADGDRLNEHVQAGRDFAVSKYSEKEYLRNLLKIYSSITNKQLEN